MSDDPKVDANEMPKTEPEAESNELAEGDLSKAAGGLRKSSGGTATGVFFLR